ncbi:hypothetical protein Droror1_Dr00024143 [Drosera rotundifolia]
MVWVMNEAVRGYVLRNVSGFRKKASRDVVDALANVLEVDEAYDTAKVDAEDLTRTAERFRIVEELQAIRDYGMGDEEVVPHGVL